MPICVECQYRFLVPALFSTLSLIDSLRSLPISAHRVHLQIDWLVQYLPWFTVPHDAFCPESSDYDSCQNVPRRSAAVNTVVYRSISAQPYLLASFQFEGYRLARLKAIDNTPYRCLSDLPNWPCRGSPEQNRRPVYTPSSSRPEGEVIDWFEAIGTVSDRYRSLPYTLFSRMLGQMAVGSSTHSESSCHGYSMLGLR